MRIFSAWPCGLRHFTCILQNPTFLRKGYADTSVTYVTEARRCLNGRRANCFTRGTLGGRRHFCHMRYRSAAAPMGEARPRLHSRYVLNALTAGFGDDSAPHDAESRLRFCTTRM